VLVKNNSLCLLPPPPGFRIQLVQFNVSWKWVLFSRIFHEKCRSTWNRFNGFETDLTVSSADFTDLVRVFPHWFSLELSHLFVYCSFLHCPKHGTCKVRSHFPKCYYWLNRLVFFILVALFLTLFSYPEETASWSPSKTQQNQIKPRKKVSSSLRVLTYVNIFFSKSSESTLPRFNSSYQTSLKFVHLFFSGSRSNRAHLESIRVEIKEK